MIVTVIGKGNRSTMVALWTGNALDCRSTGLAINLAPGTLFIPKFI